MSLQKEADEWVRRKYTVEGFYFQMSEVFQAGFLHRDPEVAALKTALKIAIEIGESWTKDQLEGTSRFDDAMAELEPLKKLLEGIK